MIPACHKCGVEHSLSRPVVYARHLPLVPLCRRCRKELELFVKDGTTSPQGSPGTCCACERSSAQSDSGIAELSGTSQHVHRHGVLRVYLCTTCKKRLEAGDGYTISRVLSEQQRDAELLTELVKGIIHAAT